MTDPLLTTGDLRAMRARYRVSVYAVAVAAKNSPSALYAFLNDRLPLDPERAERIARAIQQLADDRQRQCGQ